MTIDARDFGAAGDSRTMDTEALQRAIDACARTGGRVILQDGVFLTGTLRLRSHVELHIKAGATLLASPRCGDYPPIALARVNAGVAALADRAVEVVCGIPVWMKGEGSTR